MSPEAAITEARARLDAVAAEIARDPQTNSVRRLALDFSEDIESGRLSVAALGGVVNELSRRQLVDRIERFRDLHQLDALSERRAAFRKRLEAPADQGFGAFRAFVEGEPLGVVFTAHPTFAMRPEGYAAFADALASGSLTASADDLKAPRGGIDLKTEHAAVQVAIARAQDAVSALRADALDLAKARFPNEWRALTPRLASIASWVGYDLDGRTDIHWSASISLRLQEKASQLARYAKKLTTLAPELSQQLADAAASAEEEADAFAGDLEDPDTVVAAANRLTGADARRMTSLSSAIGELSALIGAAQSDDDARALLLVRAEMTALGLGVARLHLRVNAAQVRSALAEDLNLGDAPESFGRVALAKAADEARSTPERQINFASLFFERMTARRQFMLCKQIVKHIDADAPIRFLIAEIERPATVMGAIYLARRYGVADKVDISPLFETPEALERGGRFMEQLFDEPEYMRQARERGRVAVQIGYSDSGRFMGQVAAALSAERLQVLIARELRRRGVSGLEVLIFNTHGESMGRGAHPGSFADRLYHLTTPWVIGKFKDANAPLAREFSFQGGDGFLHFSTEETALSVLLHMLESELAPPAPDLDDRYYADINYSWDVYRALKAWQEDLFEDEGYRVALSAFAPNFLYTTGSRKTRRQTGDAAGTAGPRALRAIPNNAILQQLCVVANVCGGLGDAAGPEGDRFRAMLAASPRLRASVALAARARALTSLNVLRAYASMFDSGFWLASATWSDDRKRRETALALSDALLDYPVQPALARLAARLGADLVRLDALLAGVGVGPDAQTCRAERTDLHILHAARIALAMRALTLVAQTPTFSKRHDLSRDDLLAQAFSLRLGETAELIAGVFPDRARESAALARVAEPGEADPQAAGFARVQSGIVAPLREIADTMSDITLAISHAYGAFG